MLILFILGLVLGGVAVVFALQNVTVVTVTLFSEQITGSLALILLMAMATGIIIVLLLLLPESFSNHQKYRNLKKENKKLQDELQKQKELTVFAKHTPPTPADIAKIEQGAVEKI